MTLHTQFINKILPYFILLAALTPALAHSAPDAGAILKQQEQMQPPLPHTLPQQETDEVKPEPTEVKGLAISVRSFRFTGNVELLGEEALQALVADSIDTNLDFEGLNTVVQRITQYLKKKGWFLARAYLPKQDITEGNIEIAIVAGYLDSKTPFSLLPDDVGSVRIDLDFLRQFATNAVPVDESVHEDKLNRALLLMNDLPGVSVRAWLEPGSESGSTHVAFKVQEGPIFNAVTWLDNYGSRDTGRAQANVNLSLNDLSRRGDQINVMATHTQGIDLARLSYITPLSSYGLKLNLGYTYMNYDVLGSIDQNMGLTGDSRRADIGLSYPIIRSRTHNLYTSFNYSNKKLRDDSDFGMLREKHSNSATSELSGDRLDAIAGGGKTTWTLGLTMGNLDLSAVQANQTADALTYQTAGQYTKFNYGFSRLQRLPGTFTAFVQVTGQQARDNLDSSEKMYLGGPNGVRAYSSEEAGGDHGKLANFELRYDWPKSTPLGSLQLQAFYDIGHIRLQNNTNGIATPTLTGANSYNLRGAGLGFTIAKSASHVIRAAWASKIGSNPGRSFDGNNADGKNDDSRFWLQAMYWF